MAAAVESDVPVPVVPAAGAGAAATAAVAAATDPAAGEAGAAPPSGMTLSTPVFCLHGLGPPSVTRPSLWPLAEYLRRVGGWENVHVVEYDPNEAFQTSLDAVDAKMKEVVGGDEGKRTTAVVVIGQSMGGVVANSLARLKGWTVAHALYIVSPLHGADLLRTLDQKLPVWLRDRMKVDAHDHLISKGKDLEPPHPYNTITTSWPFSGGFDGCVWKEEGMLDPARNSHISNDDHRTVFLNPKLWFLVDRLLREARSGPALEEGGEAAAAAAAAEVAEEVEDGAEPEQAARRGEEADDDDVGDLVGVAIVDDDDDVVVGTS